MRCDALLFCNVDPVMGFALHDADTGQRWRSKSKYVYCLECGAGPIRVQPLDSWKPKEEMKTSTSQSFSRKIELFYALKKVVTKQSFML